MVGERRDTPVRGPRTRSGDGDSQIVERAAAILEQELASSPYHELLISSGAGGRSSTAGPLADWMRSLRGFGDALNWLLIEPGQPRVAPVESPIPETGRPTLIQRERSVVHLAGRGRAGEAVDVTIGLVNEDTEQPAEIEFGWTAMLAGPSRHISEDRITMAPQHLGLDAAGTGEVVMRIDLPPDADPGDYVGLVCLGPPNNHLAIVTISVD